MSREQYISTIYITMIQILQALMQQSMRSFFKVRNSFKMHMFRATLWYIGIS